MNLTRDQLKAFHGSMQSLADENLDREDLTNRSIRGTNVVIVMLFLVGTLLAGLIFGYFAALNRSIAQSIESMEAIEFRVVELRETMDAIASTVEDMGYNVEYLQFMSADVEAISQTTKSFNTNMAVLRDQTGMISRDTSHLRFYGQKIQGELGRINHSVGNVTRSISEATKPIRQFMPVP